MNRISLAREEYIEQAHLFRAMGQRINAAEPVQELLRHVREEILATSKLPMAIDYLLAELIHFGAMNTAMARMSHYFAPFQTFLIAAAESETGRFDMWRALTILESDALFRARGGTRSAHFFFQFETLCHHRLDYDRGLSAMAADPIFDEAWQRWILTVRHQLGIVDLTDLVYVNSVYYRQKEAQWSDPESNDDTTPAVEPLFTEKEGRIALANRRKEPMYFFAALQRQLEYPAVPKPQPPNKREDQLVKLLRTVEKLETRVKLLEDEQRDKGIDLSQFMRRPEV